MTASIGGAWYTQEALAEMTISQIRQLAAGLGYSISGTIKADIIESFLAEQGA